jgi:acyl-CoA carboxylase epsilon subunit
MTPPPAPKDPAVRDAPSVPAVPRAAGQHRAPATTPAPPGATPAAPDPGPGEPTPLFRVTGGNPSPEDLAALTVALTLAAAARRAAREASRPATAWPDRAAALRRPLTPGPQAWRRSALPH